jgi:hypothetical protein
MNPPHLSTSLASRLVPLCDGRPGLRSALQIEAHTPPADEIENQNSKIQNPTAPTLDFIASNEALDRYHEIIVAEGWRLDNYRRNPVFQNTHQYGDIIFTLGKALITEVRTVAGRPALYQRIEFAVAANPMARIAYALYRDKFLNAVSVGFIPIRWQEADGTERSARSLPHGAGTQPEGTPSRLTEYATRSHAPTLPRSNDPSAFRRRYLEQELLEVSAVGIPANPDALQLGLKAGAVQPADLRELLEMLRAMTAAKPSKCHDSAPMVLPSSTPHNSAPIVLPSSVSHDFAPMVLPSSGPFCSNPAAPNTHACASGVRSNEAQLLQLARALRDLLRRT